MSAFQLKRFDASRWTDYRSIRLDALKSHPDLFTPSRDEFAFSKEDWLQRLTDPKVAIFGLYFDERVVGLTGVVTDRNDDSRAVLVMSYIKEGV